MKRILVLLGLILVIEAVLAVQARVRFHHLMRSSSKISGMARRRSKDRTYRKSSGLSNFLGFLGQQSQINRLQIFGAAGSGTFRLVFSGVTVLDFRHPVAFETKEPTLRDLFDLFLDIIILIYFLVPICLLLS